MYSREKRDEEADGQVGDAEDDGGLVLRRVERVDHGGAEEGAHPRSHDHAQHRLGRQQRVPAWRKDSLERVWEGEVRVELAIHRWEDTRRGSGRPSAGRT